MKRAVTTVLTEQGTAYPFGANQDAQGFTAQALMHLDCVYNLAVWISSDTSEADDSCFL